MIAPAFYFARMKKELLLGCGSSRTKRLKVDEDFNFSCLTTLDYNEDHHPDVIHDLNILPYPFESDSFDEIHAYEVLEHCGSQGDWRYFFAQFSELWRILKDGGHLLATVPSRLSPWAFGDPSHTRVIQPESLVFLFQDEYRKQVGVTPMSDFRFIYSADFEPIFLDDNGQTFSFILKAKK
jgi:SAM-dependent methyltransferase